MVQLGDEADREQRRHVGRVEHVVSGQAAHFRTLEDLLAFMARVPYVRRHRAQYELEPEMGFEPVEVADRPRLLSWAPALATEHPTALLVNGQDGHTGQELPVWKGLARRNGKPWSQRQVAVVLGRTLLYRDGVVGYGEATGRNGELVLLA